MEEKQNLLTTHAVDTDQHVYPFVVTLLDTCWMWSKYSHVFYPRFRPPTPEKIIWVSWLAKCLMARLQQPFHAKHIRQCTVSLCECGQLSCRGAGRVVSVESAVVAPLFVSWQGDSVVRVAQLHFGHVLNWAVTRHSAECLLGHCCG